MPTTGTSLGFSSLSPAPSSDPLLSKVSDDHLACVPTALFLLPPLIPSLHYLLRPLLAPTALPTLPLLPPPSPRRTARPSATNASPPSIRPPCNSASPLSAPPPLLSATPPTRPRPSPSHALSARSRASARSAASSNSNKGRSRRWRLATTRGLRNCKKRRPMVTRPVAGRPTVPRMATVGQRADPPGTSRHHRLPTSRAARTPAWLNNRPRHRGARNRRTNRAAATGTSTRTAFRTARPRRQLLRPPDKTVPHQRIPPSAPPYLPTPPRSAPCRPCPRVACLLLSRRGPSDAPGEVTMDVASCGGGEGW